MGGPLSKQQVQLLETVNTALQELMKCSEGELMDIIRKLRDESTSLREDVLSSFSTMTVLIHLVWCRRHCKKVRR